MKKINVTIDRMGNTKIEAEGYQGNSCAEATKAIEQVLSGNGAMERTFKEEWSQEQSQHEEQRMGW